MKVKKCADMLKKLIISVLCVIVMFGAMPTKSDATILQDFMELVLDIPDAAMIILNDFIGEDSGATYVRINLNGTIAGGDDEGKIYNFLVSPYEIITNGKEVTYMDKAGGEHKRINLPILNADFFHTDTTVSTDMTKSNEILRPAIGNVYKSLRDFCMILMMLVLLYIGIKIMISASAEQQSKYKKNLVDWLVGFCLLFIMHYFMVFIMGLNGTITNMLANGESQSYYISFCEVDTIHGLTLAEGINKAIGEGGSSWDGLWGAVGDDTHSWNEYIKKDTTTMSDLHLATPTSAISNGTTTVDRKDWGDNGKVRISTEFYTGNGGQNACVYKGNILEYVRTISSVGPKYAINYKPNGTVKAHGTGENNDLNKLAYGIFYIALVIETIMFLTTYIKRLIQLAFLTMIAPFVALMYPLDKIGDGKAQSFDTWLKDYFFGVLVQPIHLLIYTIFVSAVSQLFTINIIYAIAIFVFMMPAEKYIKKIFGFEKSGSGPASNSLPNAMGHGLGMDALNRYAGIGPGSSGKGGSGEKAHKPKLQKSSGAPSQTALGSSPNGGGLPNGGGGSNPSGNGTRRSNPLGSGTGGNNPSGTGARRNNPLGAGAGGNNPSGTGTNGNRRPPIGGPTGSVPLNGGNSSSGGGGTPSAGGGSSSGGGVPATGGGHIRKFGQGIGNQFVGIGKTIGRRALRGATGGQYSDFGAGKKLVGMAIGKNIAKTGARLAGRAIGTSAGIMFSSADAIANGNFDPKKIAESAIVGYRAGDKQAQNLTSSVENFADEAKAQRALVDEDYNNELRVEDTLTNLSEDLAQCRPKDRSDYQKLIKNYAPYVNISSIDDLKALRALEEGNPTDPNNPIPALKNEPDGGEKVKELYNRAKTWHGNLDGPRDQQQFKLQYASEKGLLEGTITNPDGSTRNKNLSDLTQAEKDMVELQMKRVKMLKDL